MSLYVITLFAHSTVRWAVLASLLVVIARGALGWSRSLPWSSADEKCHKGLIIAVDAQFTLGALLYFVLSPFTQAFFASVKTAMHDTVLRFFGLEHVFVMFFAVACAHAGRTLSRRAATDRARHRRACTWSLAALLLAAIAIPWPFYPYARPLVRGSRRCAAELSGPAAAARAPVTPYTRR